ncbi:ABC transporter permease [Martelella radicis]|uniref:Peptide/nickel transport system permease protein n=1 Tax=Martelella radicis TaxID=1397476 RepID=A0A7W6KNK4_9HYPH|nr:ABC transporter permease [Martelella radicis]MBB4124561.1 peptide/nickel transport system permease protein [Martelella radicis]
MTGYIIRRLLGAIPTFFGITILVFALMQAAPGNIVDFYTAANPEATVDAARMAQVEEELGLNKPIYVQYWKWLSRVLVGDLGTSYETHRAITAELAPRMRATLSLFFFGHLIGWPLAIAIGVLSAIRPNSWIDHFGRSFALFGLSMPAFWIGAMLILVFSVELGLFPSGGSVSSTVATGSFFGMIFDRLWHLVLPALTVTLRSMAVTMRVTRAELLEVLHKDYIVTARAKGLKRRVVLIKHALRNSLMSVVTLIGLSMGHVFSGAVMTETIFSWPGVGRYLVHAVHVRDYPVVMAITLLVSVLVIIANLLTDICYSWLNPRIRYE